MFSKRTLKLETRFGVELSTNWLFEYTLGISDRPIYPFVILFLPYTGKLVILYYMSDPNYYTGHNHGNSDGYILVYIL